MNDGTHPIYELLEEIIEMGASQQKQITATLDLINAIAKKQKDIDLRVTKMEEITEI